MTGPPLMTRPPERAPAREEWLGEVVVYAGAKRARVCARAFDPVGRSR